MDPLNSVCLTISITFFLEDFGTNTPWEINRGAVFTKGWNIPHTCPGGAVVA